MEQMLVAAARVFAEHGYHAASMDEIAALADVSKPLLYRYFVSKDGLYLAIIERAGQHLVDGLALIQSVKDPLQRIEMTAMGLLTFIGRYRDLWLVMYNEAMGGSSPVAQRVGEFRAQIIADGCINISEALGEANAAGRARAEPLSQAMIGAGEAMARWWLRHPEIPLEQMAQMVLNCCYGILDRHRQPPNAKPASQKPAKRKKPPAR
jgi:AcrR family transcriptional regulator